MVPTVSLPVGLVWVHGSTLILDPLVPSLLSQVWTTSGWYSRH